MTDNARRLNRLLVLHYRSLPMYLAEAGLWTAPGAADDELGHTLANVVFCQTAMAERIAEAILDRGGTVETGSFPMEFTDTNFLSLEYMLREILERHHGESAEMERMVAAIHDDPAAKDLAQQALGEAKAHRDALESLAAKIPA